jgi:hypothetical protein
MRGQAYPFDKKDGFITISYRRCKNGSGSSYIHPGFLPFRREIISTFSERESNARRVAALGAGDCIAPDRERCGKEMNFLVNEVRAKV